MNKSIVIARAYRGEPLKRLVLKVANGCVYVANPAAMTAVENGESFPIGFPEEDVFLFDSDAYEALASEWEKRKATNPQSWRRLRRYRT
jgi:hypothetical protein